MYLGYYQYFALSQNVPGANSVSKVVAMAIRVVGSGVGRGREQVAVGGGREGGRGDGREGNGRVGGRWEERPAGKWENKLGIRQEATVTHIPEGATK